MKDVEVGHMLPSLTITILSEGLKDVDVTTNLSQWNYNGSQQIQEFLFLFYFPDFPVLGWVGNIRLRVNHCYNHNVLISQ